MIGRIIFRQTQRVLFAPLLRNNFCLYKAYQNPERHINTSHNPNNVYEDIVMIGDYPVPHQTMDKVTCQAYVPTIANIAFAHLNKKYSKAGLNANSYNELKDKTWDDLGVKIDDEKQEILVELSEQIFVKESKLRWILEQKQRLAHTTYVFSGLDLNHTRVSFLIDSYNFLLQELVKRSNFYHCKDIVGEKSFHEKHLEQQSTRLFGVTQLEENNPLNNYSINLLLRKIHNH